MLEILKIYTYREICEILGWKVAQGNTRRAQMRKLSDSYDWEYVINEKTGKLSKRILIKAYKKPLVDDYRRYNGKKKQISDEVFFYLWDSFLYGYYQNTHSDVLFFGRSVLQSVFLGIQNNEEIGKFIESYNIEEKIKKRIIEDTYIVLNSLCVDRIMRHHGYDERSFSLIDIAGDTWGKSYKELEVSCEIFSEYTLNVETYKEIFKDDKRANGYLIAHWAMNDLEKEHPEMKVIRMYRIRFKPKDLSIVQDVEIKRAHQQFVRQVLIDSLIRKYTKKLQNYLNENGSDYGLYVLNYDKEIKLYNELLDCVLLIKDDYIRDVNNISHRTLDREIA